MLLNAIFSNYSLLQAVEKYILSSKSCIGRSMQNGDLEMLHKRCNAFIYEKKNLPFLLLPFAYSEVKKQKLSLLLRLKTENAFNICTFKLKFCIDVCQI